MTLVQKDHAWSLALHAWAQRTPVRQRVSYWFARWAIWLLAVGLLLWADALGVDFVFIVFFVGIPVATSLFLSFLVSIIVKRRRPFVQHKFDPAIGVRYLGFSFPSDHATCAMSLAFSSFLFSPMLGGLAVAAAIGIALARVCVGVHYLSDILAGTLVAATVFILLGLLAGGSVG